MILQELPKFRKSRKLPKISKAPKKFRNLHISHLLMVETWKYSAHYITDNFQGVTWIDKL